MLDGVEASRCSRMSAEKRGGGGGTVQGQTDSETL